MRTFKTLAIIIVAALAFTSCKKDKDKQSKKELLISAPWVIVKYEEKENNGNWENTFPGFDDCSKDDKWIFKTDMSVDVTEGATACTGGTPNEVLESTTWQFTENETKLMIEASVLNIDQLDANTLVLSYTESLAGVTYSTRITMNH